MSLESEVLNELRALHWTSHGMGSTAPEIRGALLLRGVECTVGDVVGEMHKLGRSKRARSSYTIESRSGHHDGGALMLWRPWVPVDPIEGGPS